MRMSRSLRLEIRVLWDETLIALREVPAGKSFWIGDGTRKDVPCDFVVPLEILGVDALQLVSGDLQVEGADGAARAPLTQEAGVVRKIGPLTFALELHEGDAKLARALRRGRGGKHMWFVAASALLHAGVIVAAMFYLPKLAWPSDEPVSKDQLVLMQQYLSASAEREMESKEAEQAAESAADDREGGTGTRTRGEEGAMGTGRGNNQRYGLAGPRDAADAHISRSAGLREAGEFGMIGLLNGGAGGDPTSARGNMWGTGIGDGFGSGGVALGGVSEGGGGRGEGIGLGGVSIGQGFGSGRGRLGGSYSTMPAPQRATPAEAPIDPNGRFATTYRPGRGHLAAFESAVARGILPPAARELVSDIGASYAPQLAAPKDRALAYDARLERGALPPSGGATHFRLALRSSPQLPAGRPHLSVHLVLDVSGSMEGESISRARDAANRLVDKLAPTDDFSLVTFSSDARVRVADCTVGPNRASIHRTIDGLRTEGGTNISEGLRLGYAEAGKGGMAGDAVKVVLLLSDGRANAGVTSPAQLSSISLDGFQAGVQTSTFGLGLDYDGEVMSRIASDGAGAYYYLRDGEQIGPALVTEIDKRLDPAATAVEVRIRLRDDIKLLQVYGSRRLGVDEAQRVRVSEVAADAQAEKKYAIKRDRQEDREGGMRFYIPAFARDDSYALLIKIAAPAGAGQRDAGLVELRYKDRVAGRNVTEEIPIRVSYAGSDAESARTADGSITRTVQGFLAGESLLSAARLMDQGDRAAAASVLAEREQILRQAAESLKDPSFNADAARLARLRSHVEGRETSGEPHALAMLLETAGRSHLQ
jgi:Ca-activated chloride channel homolog